MSKINDWNFQIETAQSLYRVMVDAEQVVTALNVELKKLIDDHQDLMDHKVFFDNYAKPILKGLTSLSNALTQEDMPVVKKMIVGLHKGKAGAYGGATSSAVQSAISNFVSSLLSQMGNSPLGTASLVGKANDLEHQLLLVRNLLKIIRSANSTIDKLGAKFKSCVDQHSDLMVQYFNTFTIQNVNPRLQLLKGLWLKTDEAINVLQEQEKAIKDVIDHFR